MLHIKKFIIYLACFSAFILFVLYSSVCIEAAKEGLNLWINVVFPSLFPFFIASSMLISYGAAAALGNVLTPIMRILFKASGESGYIMATAMLSGYPMGPRLCSQMYSKGYINTSQVEHFLSFVNTSGPSFIIGAVASGMLKNAQLGIYLAISHYVGAILTGILFSIKKDKPARITRATNQLTIEPFGKVLSEAVSNAMQTQLVIGGFIILFSIIIKLLLHLNILSGIAFVISRLTNANSPELISSTLAGVFEITNSCNLLSASSVSLNILLPLIAVVISFSGFSIIMQSYALIANTGARFKALLLPKLVHAIIAYAICVITIKFFPISIAASNIGVSYYYSFISSLINSITYTIMYSLVVIIIIIFSNILRHSKKPV